MASEPDARILNIRDQVAALKRESVISAAVDLFYEHGYENTTLDAVAERLGVTKPFIYANFGSKGELLAEICSRGIALSLDAINSVLGLRSSATESLTLFCRRFVTTVLENQKHIGIYMREEKNLAPEDAHKIGEMRRNFDAKLSKLLERGVASGEFEIEDVRMASLAIGGIVSWSYTWFRPTGRLAVADIADRMTGLILALAGGAKPGDNKKTSIRRGRPK